jgi:predicted nucleic acid-binding Zn ribbon protein
MASSSQGRRKSSFRGNTIGSLLDSHFSRMGFGAKVREHLAPLVWAETVGPQIAAATEVERVHDGVLHVAVRSAMWANELTFYKPDILRRLNERVGADRDPVIRDLRFQNRGLQKRRAMKEVRPPIHPTPEELAAVDLSPRELEQIENSIRNLPDEKLQERMRHLRQTDARLRTWRMDNGWSPCPTCGDISPPHFPYDEQYEGIPDCARCRIAAYQRRPQQQPSE